MNKHLLACLLMPFALTAFAQSADSSEGQVTIGQKIDKVQKEFESIEGYIFLEVGKEKSRDISKTFDRTDQVSLSGTDFERPMGWHVSDDSIVAFDEYRNEIIGLKYGETMLTLTDAAGAEHKFLVLVCPTVTVVSPDGAIYTHQKVYNQKMKVYFSQSDHFDINCVMAKYDNEIYDITDSIDRNTGRYLSDKSVRSDVVYTVTLTENHQDEILSSRKMRLGVMEGDMKLMPSNPSDPLDINRLKNMRVVATTMKNNSRNDVPDMFEQEVFSAMGSQCIGFNPASGIHDLNITFNDGIYYIKFYEGDSLIYNYKIIINREV